ncbi:hypothetical protein NE237_006575 [Protea cynaroides]|uniref:Uncharacterized protein n=1 Tax=Protea cynaroides TaxID=273540 RepID=A0A9Q0KNG7_9MAGN|nr:hypothetical protein NE237_006575 [Protea cynaroides]
MTEPGRQDFRTRKNPKHKNPNKNRNQQLNEGKNTNHKFRSTPSPFLISQAKTARKFCNRKRKRRSLENLKCFEVLGIAEESLKNIGEIDLGILTSRAKGSIVHGQEHQENKKARK